MIPYEVSKTLRLIKQYETNAEAWTYEAQNYSYEAAKNILSYVRHLQILTECLKLDLLEDDLRLQRWTWP